MNLEALFPLVQIRFNLGPGPWLAGDDVLDGEASDRKRKFAGGAQILDRRKPALVKMEAADLFDGVV